MQQRNKDLVEILAWGHAFAWFYDLRQEPQTILILIPCSVVKLEQKNRALEAATITLHYFRPYVHQWENARNI